MSSVIKLHGEDFHKETVKEISGIINKHSDQNTIFIDSLRATIKDLNINEAFIKNLIDEKLLNNNNPFVANLKNQFGINDLSKSQLNNLNEYKTLEFHQQL